jgi:ketosteroid isomerase-like protein
MKGFGAVLILVLSTATAGASPEPSAASDQVTRTMDSFVAMDVEALQVGLAEDVTAFEMDLEGNPIRLWSRDEVAGWAAAIFADLGAMGASISIHIHEKECHTGSTLAYCTVEFDLDVVLPDGSVMSQPTRNSIVLGLGDEGWKWVHWHSSPLTPLAPPAVTEPAGEETR